MEGPTVIGKKKSRVNLDELDVSKDLLKWTKPELEAYLVHHHIKKTGNKPELIRRIQEHMANIFEIVCSSHAYH